MKRTLAVAIVLTGFGLVHTGRLGATDGLVPADITRTVYFGATDSKGAAITDLTAADLTVKEAGKERAIVSVQPATAPLDIYILVDDQGLGVFQGAVGQFLQAMVANAKFAIAVMNPQPIKVTDFINDVEGLRAGLGRLGQRGKVQVDTDQMIQAVSSAAKELQQRKAARSALIVFTTSGEKALADRVEATLSDLKNSGAAMSVLMYTGVEIGKVLGDGPKQSGGTIQQAGSGVGVGPAVGKIIDNLQHQYMLTYTLPDGVKPSDRFSLTTSRKGITLIAPNRIPDK